MTSTLFDDNPDRIRCISLHRPWAEWVIWGWKTIETRTHSRFAGLNFQRIGIHASQKWDESAFALASKWLTEERIARTLEIRHKHAGELIGTVRVDDFLILTQKDSESAMIECDTKRFGLFLIEPVMFHVSIPIKGHQGVFFHEL